MTQPAPPKPPIPASLDKAFPFICFSVAAYFGLAFSVAAGFPPTTAKDHWVLLAGFILFVLLPFVRKIDLFQLVSLERNIADVKEKADETKEKVKELQQDIRNVLTAQQTLTSAIHLRTSNAQTIYVGGYERPAETKIEEAQQSLKHVRPAEVVDKATGTEVMNWLQKIGVGNITLVDEDKINSANLDIMLGNPPFAAVGPADKVILTRTKIEAEMKRLLQNLDISLPRGMSQRNMLLTLMDYYALLQEHREAFDVFFKIANPLVHAEAVPKEDIDHAGFIGERLLTVLKSLEQSDA